MSLVLMVLMACGGPVEEGASVPMRETPWRIDFYDGSGNSYRFERAGPTDPARATYDPVDPANSSSGTYSGGDPWTSELAAEEAAELWRWVDGLAEDPSLRAERREMGTGLVRVRSPGGEQSVVIKRTNQLTAFETYLPSLK